MATQDDTTSSNDLVKAEFVCTADGLHFIKTDNEIELHDQLNTQLARLSSMLHMITGEGFDGFSTLNDKIQHEYLDACTGLSEECRQLASLI